MMNRRERRAEQKYRKSSGVELSSATQAAFEAALQHHQAGRLQQAEPLYRQVLTAQPRHADSLHLLGVMAQQIGRHELAVDLIGQAVAVDADVAMYHSNLGNALKAMDRLDEAASSYRRAIALSPAYAEAHNNLGTVLQALGQWEAAVASVRRAIDLKPDLPEAHNNLGNLLVEQGQREEAVAAYRRAIAYRPAYPEALNNLGATLKELGQIDTAISYYRRAIDLQPDFAGAHNNLGNALHEQGAIEQAMACYRRTITLQPAFAGAHSNLGNALRDHGALDEAILCYRRAIALDPGFADAHCHLGVALHEQGALDEACAAFDAAIELAPRRGGFHRLLVNTGRVVPGSREFARLEALANEIATLPEADRLELHFALGTMYADCGEAEKSFAHLLDGNLLKRHHIHYDEAAALALFERSKGVVAPERFTGWAGELAAPVPIFVVGMPRSGTTLVEQILASHPDVHGAGELMDLPDLIDRLTQRPDGLAGLGAAYLAKLRARCPSASHIVDKLPHNFLRIGLIRAALPDAKIIHVERDPFDTCLSCFSKLFTDEQTYSYDLGELGRYYRGYQDLMAHWRAVLPPGGLLEVRYEDVVSDLPGQTRRMLDYCGLGWDDACLAFHENRRRVRTASAAQVRRPLYASSVGRWRAFSELAGPRLGMSAVG